MTTNQTERSRRALAAGVEWRAGMRAFSGGRPGRLFIVGGVLRWQGEGIGYAALWPIPDSTWPMALDTDDPATLGCIVAQARAALREPIAYARFTVYLGGWCVCRENSGGSDEYLRKDGAFGSARKADLIAEPTEADAWIAAIEAAQRRRDALD